jgi:hypothetical protein
VNEQPNQLADTILKYALGSFFTTRITHMKDEEIFGSCEEKPNLPLGLEGDSHKHNHVNLSCPCVNINLSLLSLNSF